ncbi:hypothetical protein [Streptomyces sp. BPTC-684]|uniref:hypothetical protein n=1 Tax=Streptomyces sp. BPTC-684 TaxID=3043734 RepID=UPI0024B1335C|nr:hypothetical protein [Streptomyces sp. BPTC-684]WHM40528.1 hypothetical protein QIY60_29120 [Streptomyces sp. BPTC-684]
MEHQPTGLLARLWLTGPAAGRHDTLADDLPGFPDSISRSPGGGFRVALAGPRAPPPEWLGCRGLVRPSLYLTSRSKMVLR